MSNGYGTFPYKLWDLINSSKNNGISWSNDGKSVIIHKKLFQRKCLDKGIFKTSKFLSFTKQLNVYGFVQQAHRFGPRMTLAYKHDNFQQEHRELLRDFCRRVTISSSNNKTPSSKMLLSSQQQKSSGVSNNVMQARLNFKCILDENVQKVLALPSDLTSCCDSDSSMDVKVYYKERPQNPLPPRKDPRFLMWNGCSNQPDINLHASNMHMFPNTTFSFKQQNPQHVPIPSNPVNESFSSIVVCLVDNEEPNGDKNFLSFAMEEDELNELKEILLDEEFDVMYEEFQAMHEEIVITSKD